MKIRTAKTIAALVVMLSQIAMSAEKLESRKVEIDSGPTVERVWQHRGAKLGAFRGTFDGITTNRAFIIDPWGERLEIPLFSFSAPDLSHIMNRLARFPAHAEEYTLTPGRRKLIDVSADDLHPGKLGEWENRGVLGGAFHAMHVPPTVVDFEGRRAVKFDVWEDGHIDINYQIMTGDFCVNEYLGAGKPFTLTAWIYKNRNVVEDESTILSWHAIGGDYGTRICFSGWEGGKQTTKHSPGRSDVAGLSRAATADVELLDEWQHAAFVYTGGEDGTLRYYRNGMFVSESTWDNLIEPIAVEQITETSAVVRAQLRSRKGRASVGLYIGEKDHHHWFQQRHWHWDQELTQFDVQAGELRFEVRDLKPGTKYYFRLHAIDTPGFWWNYDLNDLRRWNDGPWSIVTAGEDGTPGKVLPRDQRKHFFIGGDWGSRWYYAYPGPSKFFDGHINSIKLFDYAMNQFEISSEFGVLKPAGPSPANGSEVEAVNTDLSWSAGTEEGAKFHVYIATDRDDVEARTVEPFVTEEPLIEEIALKHGRRYYWQVDELNAQGKTVATGDVWEFHCISGLATGLNPDHGEVIDATGEISWNPGPDTLIEQNIYIARSLEALNAMTEPTASLPNQHAQWGLPSSYDPTMHVLHHGGTYYWKVENVLEDGFRASSKIARFRTRDYFTPEADEMGPEPLPDDNKDAAVGAMMTQSRFGYPSISSPGPYDDGLVQTAYGTAKLLTKHRIQRLNMLQGRISSRVSTEGGDGRRFESGYVPYTYGYVMKREGGGYASGALLFHEAGHAFGRTVERVSSEFVKYRDMAWVGYSENNIGLGGYNAADMGEQDAVSLDDWLYGAKRDAMYRSNRLQYLAIQAVASGDLYIDLMPAIGAEVDDYGNLLSWENNGGYEARIDDVFARPEETIGHFMPVGENIALGTSGSVSAAVFSGESALVWDMRTRYGLYGNRDFAVEFWVRKDSTSNQKKQLLAGWGDYEAGTRFYFDSDSLSYSHCGGKIAGRYEFSPEIGKWYHVVYAYRGGGAENGPGAYEFYLDGKLIETRQFEFDLQEDAVVFVGGEVDKSGKVTNGFHGSIGHLRIYNYDISHWQVEEHFEEERDIYVRPTYHVADKLYVDMESQSLTDVPRGEHRPTYPAKMRRPWLRSWSNHGLLGKRLHNDIHSYMWGYSGSTPYIMPVAGSGWDVVRFQGKDRMVSGFMPSAEMVSSGVGTLEAWVYCEKPENATEKEVLFQWDDFEFDTTLLQKGWQHVAIVFDHLHGKEEADLKKAAEKSRPPAMLNELYAEPVRNTGIGAVYVNGVKVGQVSPSLKPRKYSRLHVGGYFDNVRWNWKFYFHGSVASLRIHKGQLTEEQIQANFEQHQLNTPHAVTPQHHGFVDAADRPALSWVEPLLAPNREGRTLHPVYFGTDADDLELVGEFPAGAFQPPLASATTYHWRAGNSPVYTFTTHKDALIDMDAADLEEGRLEKWTNRGSYQTDFLTGSLGDALKLEVQELNGKKAIAFAKGWPTRMLTSSFDAPEALRKGPFTIYYEATVPTEFFRIRSHMVLNWGHDRGNQIAAAMLGAHAFAFSTEKQDIDIYRRPQGIKWVNRMQDPPDYYWIHGLHLIPNLHDYAPKGDPRYEIVGKQIQATNPNAMMGYYWHRNCIVYDGTSLRSYWNGMLLNDEKFDYQIEDLGKLFLGSDGDIMFRKLEVFSAALDDDQVAELSNGGDVAREDRVIFVEIPEDVEIGQYVSFLENKGTAGGWFSVAEDEDHAPEVKEVDGQQAVYFNGESAFLRSTYLTPDNLVGLEPFTIDIWAYLENHAAGSRLLSLTSDVAVTPGIFRGRSVPTGQWCRITLVSDGGINTRMRAYINGERVEPDERNSRVQFVLPGMNMTIGGDPPHDRNTDYFKGAIKSIRVYDYARSEAAIAGNP